MAEQEIKENSYSKLGVISRTIERGFMGDTMGSLLEGVDDGGQEHNKGFRFSIPTIVESFASLRVSDGPRVLVQIFFFHWTNLNDIYTNLLHF